MACCCCCDCRDDWREEVDVLDEARRLIERRGTSGELPPREERIVAEIWRLLQVGPGQLPPRSSAASAANGIAA